jgi:hypothetical protein
MQPFRATLTDDAGQAIADIEGSMDSPDEAQGARKGEFEIADNETFMQAVLEQKTFGLRTDAGDQLTIAVNSVAALAKPGHSRVEFSVS